MSARWRVDLHVHTRASFDCLMRAEDVVRVARQRGLRRIAITDHNSIEGALEAHARDPELVIIGEEVKSAERIDVSGLFLKERISAGLPAREIARAIRAQGGIVYIPHPFARGKGMGNAVLEELREFIDAVEVFNARMRRPGLNERAAAWARAHGVPGGAGSDAHTLREIGRGVVEMPPFRGAEDFLQALGSGEIRGSPSGAHVHFFSTWAKFWRVVEERAG